MIRTYAIALKDADTVVRLETLPLRTWEDRPDRALAGTKVHLRSGRAVPLQLLLRHRDGAWRAIDMRIDGVSIVKGWRATLRAHIARGGVARAIESLRERNESAQAAP